MSLSDASEREVIESGEPAHEPPSRSAFGAVTVSSRALRYAAGTLIVLGIIVRLVVYLARRPLWSDEAMVSLNIASRGFGGLMHVLAYDQTAPILFLWGEKAMVLLGGVNEYALRIIPLICGCALLILLWTVTRRMLGEREALVATILAVVSTFLIYHSSEVKQYGTDAFFTIALLAAAVPVFRSPSSRRAWTWLIAVGALVLFASQPSVFILAGVGVALVVSPDVRAVRGWLARCATAAVVWGACFIGLYFGLYRATANSAYMLRFWKASFLTPGAPQIKETLMRLGANVLVSPYMPTPRNALAACFAVVFLIGVVELLRRRVPALAVMMLAPYAAFLAANVAGKFPIASRLLLFLAPLTFMIYGLAVVALVNFLPRRMRTVAFAIACLLLLVWRGPSVVDYAVHPPRIEDSRKLIVGLERARDGAPVYIFGNGAPAWVFYSTNWSAPDTARLSYMARMESSTGPAFGNRPSRGHAVIDEGDSLMGSYRGRREILGVGSGAENYAGIDRLDAFPDSGWSENEVRRMRNVANPYLWVFIAAQSEPEVDALSAALGAAGAVVDARQVRSQAMLYRVRFPQSGPQGSSESRYSP